MKIKDSGEEFVRGNKISGTVDNFTLSFGKHKNDDCSAISPSYLQWMYENMQLSEPENNLLGRILGGSKPKGKAKVRKKNEKPLWASKITTEQAAEIKANEEKTRPPRPALLQAKDELRIQNLEKSLKAANSKIFELIEQLNALEEYFIPKEKTKEHQKIERALSLFEKELDMNEEKASAHPQEY